MSEQWLERQVSKGQEKETQYFVYVAEASLAFQNGMTIPLLSEFLDYTQGDTSNDKQDCEQRAFRRLVARLKREFPRLPIMLLFQIKVQAREDGALSQTRTSGKAKPPGLPGIACRHRSR